MNIMVHPTADASATTHEPAMLDINQAHILRSKIVGKCAEVERWLTEQISIVEKPELMFSQKIEQLKKLSDQKKLAFKHPQKLQDRLEAFRSFADFRSEIVHSEMTFSMLDGAATIIFVNTNQACKEMLRKKLVISTDGLNRVWQDMSSAANVLITLKSSQFSASPQKKPAPSSVTPA